MSIIIGIDLGTTYSLVGVMQGNTPCLIPNGLGETLTPSAVGMDMEGRILVGARAKSRQLMSPDDVVTSFKRDMGTDQTYTLGGNKFRPEELSSLILKSLKDDAQQFLGKEIKDCVISVPAYFGEAQRQATKTAAELAGLTVKRLINEPTAAALAFGVNNLGKETKAVVLDLGGGTFDVTVLQIMEGVVEVLASSGDTRLGGDDFDSALAEYVYRKAAKPVESGGLGITLSKDPLVKARVKEVCQRVKHNLSTQDKSIFRFENVTLEITKDEAMELWIGLRERMRGPILQALKDAKTAPESMDEILLVGGSTRMPLVRELAQALFNCPIHSELPPDEAVAMGACVAAGLYDQDNTELEIGLTDVNPFTLGINTCSSVDDETQVRDIFHPIIPRGTVIPCSRVHEFTTVRDNQEELNIEVFQGEHIQAGLNTKIGTFTVGGIPRDKAGVPCLGVRFTYDLNGLLEVEVSVKGTKIVVARVFENSPGKMSPEDIAKARSAMARYKIAPKDEAPNKVALERAEALAVTLTGKKKEQLTLFVAEFLGALDSQDAKLIEEMRQKLNAHVLLLGSIEEWE